mmetsp:Transcript_35133/g.59139  ORF Transcript_35133/g.59139 Transcript_35133/m.59139 type:complete len:138 (-) Transcript_35133:264-677(-)|eukprot:CAMPEP_0198200546 /NCGR_PEP_ID=MMETSP1445-20131203/3552_1 /TAXON_ID=36898 /ORGANISM="Pyramimonas sp., Strain CCMP2087" /LENGTH=137 /DNA_ID=CAMNT_0043870659 /DNA_START=48 /DNA_END=461 /DNA_ORIENTATION=+
MDNVKVALTKTLPLYLKGLPVPSDLAACAALSKDQWIQLAPVLVIALLVSINLLQLFLGMLMPATVKPSRNNTSIKLTEAKVVDARTVGALTESLKDVETLAFCRCWKSSTFPMCNGAHVKHNKETGDNVGPLLVKK